MNSHTTKYDLIDSTCTTNELWQERDGVIAKALNSNPDVKECLKQHEWGKVLAAEVASVKKSKVLDAMLNGRLEEDDVLGATGTLSKADVTKHMKGAKKAIRALLECVEDESSLYSGFWTQYHELNRLVRIGSRLDDHDLPS